MAEKKSKKEKVPFRYADKNPYIGVILEILWAAFWIMGVGSLIGGILARICAVIPGIPAFLTAEGIPTICGIIASILVIIYNRKRMGSTFDGHINNSDNRFGYKLMIVWVLYWLAGLILVIAFSKLGMVSLVTVIAALGAGVIEETAFRIIPLYFVMRHRENRKLVIYSVVITSIIFGVTHMSNINSGAPVDVSILQSAAAAFMGIFFAACYLRTGNILFGILPHFINDVVAGFDVGSLGENLVFTAGLQPQNYIDLGMVVIIGCFGLYLIRPSKYSDIKVLWDKKFMN